MTQHYQHDPPTRGPSREDQIQAAVRFLGLLRDPGEVVELRALEVQQRYGRPATASGYYRMPDDAVALAAAATDLTTRALGVYVTLNPVLSALLSRYCRRVQLHPKCTTGDSEIVARRWVMVDIDPVRPAFLSATDDERRAAADVAAAIRAHLDGTGWPAPIVSHSGNGVHLLYPIVAPTDDAGDVQRLLQGLAAKFDTDRATVDTTTFNPSRLVRLPGTFARKGDDTPDRPHRMARLVEVPGT